MIIEKISKEQDKVQALDLIQSKWPEKNRGYLDFFLEQNQDYCLEAKEPSGKVVGVLLARLASKKDIWWLEIQIVIVEEKERKKGIGSTLLAKLEEVCEKEKIRYLFLSSGEEDLADGSFLFYLRNGFKIVGAVRNPGESLLYFQKNL